jgi:hypothetical protein
MRSVKLTNLALVIIYKLSETLTLEDQGSMARRRFLRMLKPYIDDLNLEQNDIIRRYVDKEENGEPKQSKNKEYLFENKEKNKLYLEAWDKLNKMQFKIDVMDYNRQDIIDMAKYLTEKITETEKKNDGKYLALTYDSIQDAKEAVEMLNILKEGEDKEDKKPEKN